MKRMLFTLSLALLCTAVVGQRICEGSFMSDDGNWQAEWTLSSDNLYVDFTVRAVTEGWLGIGFSLDQMMPQTDMVIGAINADGSEYSITDRYAEARMPAPPVDAYQNITNLGMERVMEGGQTYTVMYFRRPVYSNNDDDIALSEDLFLLYAWGNIANDDIDMIQGHAMTDRGFSAAIIDFICACEGSFMSDDGNWQAEWTLTTDNLFVDFTVRAVTEGWLGIGFSMNQAMPQTDMVIGAINANGSEYSITDRYAEMRTPAPPVDDYQNITNLRMERVMEGGQTYTVMYFRRPVCSNNDEDIALSEDPFLLYAWSTIANDDIDMIQGHMMSDRGFSAMRFDFVCKANQGSFVDTAAGISWDISWEVSSDASQATFQVVAQTDGWIGIGFSENNIMPYTDIIVGASDGINMSYVSDRYASARAPPSVDAYQGITYENADQIDMGGNTYTRVNFTRPTVSTDDQDISLNNGPLYILVAWGMEDNFNGSDPMSIMRHSNMSRAVLPNTYAFFRCGAIVVEPDEPDDGDRTTGAPPDANDSDDDDDDSSAAVVSITTILMLIPALIAVVNI